MIQQHGTGARAHRPAGGRQVRDLQPALQRHAPAHRLGHALQHDLRDDRLPAPREARLAGVRLPAGPDVQLPLRLPRLVRQDRPRHPRCPGAVRAHPDRGPVLSGDAVSRGVPLDGRMGRGRRAAALASLRVVRRSADPPRQLRLHAAVRRLRRLRRRRTASPRPAWATGTTTATASRRARAASRRPN